MGFRNGRGAAIIALGSDPDSTYRYCWWNGRHWESALIAGTRTWWDGNKESELPGGGDLHPRARFRDRGARGGDRRRGAVRAGASHRLWAALP